MLKHKYALAAVFTGVTLLASAISVAADTAISSEKATPNGVYVIKTQEDLVQLKEKLAETGIDCDLPGMPDIILPEFPDTDIPESNLPEAPDTDPETPEEDTDISNNSYAMQVIHLVNQERAKEGLLPLTYDANIEKAALIRAKETEVSFSHTRPDGTSFSTALQESGVSFRSAGENIAWGQKSPEEVMNGWMNSPGHRANILNKNFTKIGVGYYQNSQGVNYWTQLFTA